MARVLLPGADRRHPTGS